MIGVVHPTGNEFVRALLQALERSGEDYQYWTTIATSAAGTMSRMLPKRLRTEFARRDPGIPARRVRTQPLREFTRLCAKQVNWKYLTRHETGWACTDAVYRSLDRKVARQMRAAEGGFDTVHAYEDGALESFQAAREFGAFCSYELPIAYWETGYKLMQEEVGRYPDWKATMVGTINSPAKLERKTQELELADLVVCPSRFVWSTLPARIRAQKRCVVAPFGSPNSASSVSPCSTNRKLRVLFVGSMTQRKGLADLFAAMRLLKGINVELVVMGSLMQPIEFYRERCEDFIYEPPRPHFDVLALMRTCDALVLPSIVEGRALVQQEALSCGLPLIVTANAGGEDLIDEGRTGFLIPIRSPEKIAEKIAWLAMRRELLPDFAEYARAKAKSVSWTRYGETILRFLGSRRESKTEMIDSAFLSARAN